MKDESPVCCISCYKTRYVRWIVCCGDLFSEIENRRVTVNLYQCDDCKTVFINPLLER
jgi:hypothetical protein